MIEKYRETSLKARARRKRHIRTRISGTLDRPRLVVYRSLKQIYCQLVNDVEHRTLLGCSTVTLDVAAKTGLTKVQQSKELGKLLAEKAKAKGIEKVVFDRNGYPYHGRVAAVAEGAREGGLVF